MPILIFNLIWMIYNCLLALFAVIFGYLAFVKGKTFFRPLWMILWLIFLPNTIYILTDFSHFFEQSPQVPNLLLPLLLFEYVLLFAVGIVTFFASIFLFDSYLHHLHGIKNKHWTPFVFIAIINLLTSIGVMMGRLQRTNSWEVFTNPLRVLFDFSVVISNPRTMVFIFTFSILTTTLYYILKHLGESKRRKQS